MCGIVGLFLKTAALRPQLGTLTARMLNVMSERGPDSAGFAIYGSGHSERIKITARMANTHDMDALAAAFKRSFGRTAELALNDSHAIFTVPVSQAAAARTWLQARQPPLHIV